MVHVYFMGMYSWKNSHSGRAFALFAGVPSGIAKGFLGFGFKYGNMGPDYFSTGTQLSQFWGFDDTRPLICRLLKRVQSMELRKLSFDFRPWSKLNSEEAEERDEELRPRRRRPG